MLNLQASATESKPASILHSSIVVVPLSLFVFLDRFLGLHIVHLLIVEGLLLPAEETSKTM